MSADSQVPYENTDPTAFRRAAGCFATGVSILTAADHHCRWVGSTINFFLSVSLEPPLVSVSLARSLTSLPIFERAGHFAISVLGEEYEACAARFAARGEDKWSGTPCATGTCGAPLIVGAIVTFECARYAMHDDGDHLILLGRVISLTSAPSRCPLIFHGWAFVALGATRMTTNGSGA